MIKHRTGRDGLGHKYKNGFSWQWPPEAGETAIARSLGLAAAGLSILS
jgi:hypothetical protein